MTDRGFAFGDQTGSLVFPVTSDVGVDVELQAAIRWMDEGGKRWYLQAE